MTRIADRTVLFADLRGSTALFETLGNAEATSVVTHCIAALGRPVAEHEGHVVKTLGDGLMAVFADSAPAVLASIVMHEALDGIAQKGRERGASPGLKALRLQIGMARGEVVEMGGDCFGDAVNVAARLLDHAGDNETLVTDDVLRSLGAAMRGRFRSLDRLTLRGRVEPVAVHVLGRRRGGDAAITQFGDVPTAGEPAGLRLSWNAHSRIFEVRQLPVVLGRSPQAAFCVDDSRVSRSHARIDCYGGSFQLTDLSFNGTYVRFADGEIVSLRRGSCTLHGSGTVGLGSSPVDAGAACVNFEVVHCGDARPQEAPDSASGQGPRR